VKVTYAGARCDQQLSLVGVTAQLLMLIVLRVALCVRVTVQLLMLHPLRFTLCVRMTVRLLMLHTLLIVLRISVTAQLLMWHALRVSLLAWCLQLGFCDRCCSAPDRPCFCHSASRGIQLLTSVQLSSSCVLLSSSCFNGDAVV
jgi:hypothetical protein